MNKLIEINREKTKLEHQKSQAEFDLKVIKAKYHEALVEDIVEELIKIQSEEGAISERDLKIYLNNLTADVRNLYDKH